MTNETRTPKEIEREIEAQRSDLTSNLEDLQDKFSIDSIVRQIGDQFRENGGDMGRSIANQVKANPIPLALTGIGLAWMMFGNAQKQSAPARIADHRDEDRYGDVERDYRRTREAQGCQYLAPSLYPANWHDGPTWAHDEDDGPSITDRISSGVASARDTAAQGASAARKSVSSAASSVSDAANVAGSKVANAASTTGSKVSSAAASAKSSVTGAAQSVQDSLATVSSRIAEGTENLTEEGRRRVIAARQRAVTFRRQTARKAQNSADAAADFYDSQPLVVGAMALAVGAAFGGALPRTRAEDDLMGSQSDSLIVDAERIFEEEKAKAMAVAASVKDELQDIASEVKRNLDSGAPGDKTASQAVGDKAKSVAARVADTAQTAAKDEKLGKPEN